MEPTYLVVKYDVFPGFVVHKLDRIENGQYYVEGMGRFHHGSILGLCSYSAAKELEAAISNLKTRLKNTERDVERAAKAFLRDAIGGGV